MKGRNNTELVQSTRDRKNTSIKSEVLYSVPPILVVSPQNADNRKEDAVPTINNNKMQLLSDIYKNIKKSISLGRKSI